ncbi:hypothetical protein GGR42_001536 [Saonia flava]|uniref:Outer membrane protein beta-barrel domain-containing protein n=1 Tax=Saonia flava TaxID=523696 RepID=A0A846R126_9FLAO|nr:hypothetical protein [Saonia flava]NJB71074.1 hypothetical protein [Saonia flava]
MKNIRLAFALFFLGVGIHAQEGFKLGFQAGLPFNDFNNEVSVVVALDVGYVWTPAEFLDLGIMTGFVNGFSESFHSDVVLTDLPNVQFIPVAGSVRVWPSNSFSLGIEAGQALGINKDNEGGLYLRPLMGYLMGPKTEVNVSYTTIQLDNKSWSTVTLGLLYTFKSDW